MRTKEEILNKGYEDVDWRLLEVLIDIRDILQALALKKYFSK